MIVGNNNYWLGTMESFQPVLDIQKAKSDGTLLKIRLENPDISSYHRGDDDEDRADFRMGEALLQIQDGVAVINIQGGLVSAYAWYNSWFGVVSYEEIKDAIMLAVEDDNIKSILLNVNSPGGAVSYLDELADFIRSVDSSIKPVYGHTTSCACSAGYWLLSSCRKITASKAAMTGSIGVIATHVSQKGYMDKMGVEFHYIRSGEYKALGQSGEDFTKEAEAEMSKLVMGLFKFFTAQVLQGRGQLAAAKMSDWNTGKVFLSEESKALGLIDEINTFDSCIAKLYKNSNNGYMSSNADVLKDTLMKQNLLTKEQAAKFASGVPVDKLGLSAESLAEVNATIDKHKESLDAEPVEEEIAAKVEEEISAEDVPADKVVESTSALTAALAQNADLNKQLGKLEGKIELLQENQKSLQEAHAAEISQLESTQKTLTAIAAKAANRLQVAVGARATDLDNVGAASVISQYNAAENTLEKTFKIGATSVSATESRKEQASLQPRHNINKVK